MFCFGHNISQTIILGEVMDSFKVDCFVTSTPRLIL